MTVFVIVLIAICAKLWGDVSELKRRMSHLEALPRGVAEHLRPTAYEAPASVVPTPPPSVDPGSRGRERKGYVSPWASQPGEAHEVFRPAASVERPMVFESERIAHPEVVEPVAEPVTEPVAPVRIHSEPPVSRRDVPVRHEESREFSFEGLFGRTLPIWAGGITLAVAGILVVKWSIDMGLVSPAVRICMGLLFGLGLVGGADLALRRGVSDERIPQALAGAGVTSLYGALLAANLMYGLLGDGTTLLGMVVVTLAAGALSMRFGSPCAVLGLAGGLVAPALVGGGTPSVPLLAVYVAMVSGGIAALARVQKRSWLGGLSMAGAGLWAFALLSAVGTPAASIALGLLMLFIGLAIPHMLPADREGFAARTAGGLLAVAQTAVLVAMGGFGITQWSMLALATAAVLWTSEQDDRFRDMPALALGVLAATVVVWPDPDMMTLGVVLTVFTVLHALHALRHLTFTEVPRMADGIRLIALPVLVCMLVQFHAMPTSTVAFVLWGIGAVVTAGAIAFVSASGLERLSSYAQPMAVSMGALALGCVLPVQALPAVLVAAAAGLHFVKGWRIGAGVAAGGAVIWGLPALVMWFAASFSAVFSSPLLTSSLPSVWFVTWSVVPAVAAAALLYWREQLIRMPAAITGGVLGVMGLHVLWRNVVGISTAEEFTSLGLLDRTLWEAVLAAAAVAAWRLDRRIAAGLGLSSLLHFAWFTVLRYDPLWSEQVVGPVPFLNLATLSHAVPLALLWAAGRTGLDENWERIRKVCQMTVIFSMGMVVLRQLFAGTMPFGVPISEAEDIMRSVLAVAIALGFLVHGIWSSSIEWRAGSLVLMLGAVTKVFLFDASGLDGLARVASFAALGFSLIGVGWLYSRLLPRGGVTAMS